MATNTMTRLTSFDLSQFPDNGQTSISEMYDFFTSIGIQLFQKRLSKKSKVTAHRNKLIKIIKTLLRDSDKTRKRSKIILTKPELQWLFESVEFRNFILQNMDRSKRKSIDEFDILIQLANRNNKQSS